MIIKKRLISLLSEQTLDDIISEQNFVISKISKLNQFFPEDYKKIDLLNMILVKTYGYHTLFKEVYNYNMRCVRVFDNLVFSNYLSQKIANQRTKISHRNLSNELDINREEIPKNFIQSYETNYSKIFSSNLSWNIFCTNMQSYLHVLIKTINASSTNNNLLLIPKEFSKLEIIKNIEFQKVIYFDDFLTDEIIKQNLEIKEEFKKIYNNNSKKLSDLFTIRGLNYFNLLENGIKNVFYYLIPQALLFYKIFENINRKIKIKNIIGCRVRRTFDRVSYTFAKNNYINTFIILHSTIQPNLNELYSTGYFNDIDGIFVWGENHEKLLNLDSQLSKNSKIYALGSPLFEYKAIKKKKVNNKVILFAAGKDNMKEIKLLIKIISCIDHNVKLLIKGHPTQDAEKYELLANEFVEIIPYTDVIENYYDRTDILITAYSGAHLTAMIEKIPVIFFAINFQTMDDLYNIYALGDKQTKDLIAINKKELKKKIIKILFDTDFESSYLRLQNKYINQSICISSNSKSAAKKINNIINKY